MNRVERLAQSYGQYIAVPWRDDIAPAQKVLFCVYSEADELRLRARIDEFKLATRNAGHEWCVFDLTDTFADWLVKQRYAKSYFERPQLLTTLLSGYLEFIHEDFKRFLDENRAGANTVVAIKGAGSLFGFLRVKDVIDKFTPLIQGRMAVFFPGTFENNNYRLLDAYDGWNYLAVPIVADKQF